MKINKLLPILFLGILASCEDTIDSDNRYTPASTPEVKRSVLVEEYTGTTCLNCPHGHALIESLQEYYNTEENLEQGNELIVVGIHIPNWGLSVTRGGFITPEAADLTPEGVNPPQAQVNRTGQLLDRPDWSKIIAQQFCREPEVTFPDRLLATVDSTTIMVQGIITSGNNYADARLHVWLVEDNITYRQRMPDGNPNYEYVHQNVYRAFMTASYAGDDFPLTRNVARTFTKTYPVSESWDMNNMRVVVFVETPTGGVLNACQTKIIAK